MADRKVDSLISKGSLADTLRKRRNAIEAGDPSGGANTTDDVVARGYRDETDDDEYGREKPYKTSKGW